MKESTDAVVVKNVRKEFILPQYKNRSIKQAFINIFRRPTLVKQKALDGVSFTVEKGDFFGIVGRNGSGKSTLLKILAGVYQPTDGSVKLNGKLTPFIELGVGFNPELSGRDNVFLNGALLGFTRKDMENMYDEIVEFAELDQFMDQKLKNYSSGMQVRLAFSIAIKAKNEILIFDEVLAVGDEAFQAKCFDTFEKYKASNQTVILVTHDMSSVKKFCNKAIMLEDGVVRYVGDPRVVADQYSRSNLEVIEESLDRDNAIKKDKTDKIFLKVKILSQDEKRSRSYRYNDKLRIELDLSNFPADATIESVGVNIFKHSGEHVTGENSRFSTHATIDIKKVKKMEIDFNLTLQPGRYGLYVEVYKKPGVQLEAQSEGLDFLVTSAKPPRWSGLTELKHEWIIPKTND